MKMHLRRLCCSVMAVVTVLTTVLPIVVAETPNSVQFRQVDDSLVSASVMDEIGGDVPVTLVEEQNIEAHEMIRVSIVLDKEATIDMGYSTMGIAENSRAMNYRQTLAADQARVTRSIEQKLGENLDVEWNLTLVANIISANVEYGQIEAIKQISGVKNVLIEPQHSLPEPITSGDMVSPTMYSATDMIGMNQVWSSGYTGAGMRIAIIDTGLDTDHQSFSEAAWQYALQQNAAEADMNYEDYVASLNLLDVEELSEKLGYLNIQEKNSKTKPEELYKSGKIPFAFNYIDSTASYVTHDQDSQTDHGSHVAGTAAANRFIEKNGQYVDAEETCKVVGNAPDAQIIVMKVFGKMGGAYTSDYMAAIEDAIILGCASVNLSLGSTAPGFSDAGAYREIMESLTQSDTVVAIAGGNEYYPVRRASNSKFLGSGYLYAEDAVLPTNLGAPGTYTNSLAVASVNNKMSLMNGYISVSGKDSGSPYIPEFSETIYNNMKKMISLDTSESGTGTVYDYVFLDSNGYQEDYTGLDVAGKIVFCSRGDIAFYEKAENAVEAGAIATIIYNNEPGMINMDLTSYTKAAPAISITKEAGEKIKALSNPVVDGNRIYFTGTLNVVQGQLTISDGNDYYTMSDFSSWGTTGDLALKPEITAPGGNIYSVRGDVAATDQYKTNSGTSMATPQVSGVAAAVSQFIQKTNFGDEYGYTLRHRTQSLLMSTATPLKDKNGNYYSLLQQGAGLINGSGAVNAKSFIIMGSDATPSYADGKVKAELGDDPDKKGVYEFSFTIYNEADVETEFKLSADVFTQDVIQGESAEGSGIQVYYSQPGTRSLTSATIFTRNGQRSEDSIVTVEAGGSAQVGVRMVLADEAKAWLNTYYPKGAYMEAFVYVDPQANAEGADSTTHSIPVLAFYGNWTDPTMYDTASYANGQVVSLYNTENTTDHSRVSYAYQHEEQLKSYYGCNHILVKGHSGETYALGGNPLIKDDVYQPDRDAISGGVEIVQWNFAIIRNGAWVGTKAVNETSGQTYFSKESETQLLRTYYDKNAVAWQYFPKSFYLHETLPTAAEGDRIKLSLQVLPEYYMEGNQGYGKKPGEGSELSITVSVDTTIPEVDSIKYNAAKGALEVVASDNNYISGMVLYSDDGTEIISYTGADLSAEQGQDSTFAVKPSGENSYLLQVFDYAMNVCTYYIELEEEQIVFSGAILAYDLDQQNWVQVDRRSDKLSAVTEETKVYTAATAVEDVIYAIAYGTELHRLNVSDATDSKILGDTGVELVDLAYNVSDQMLYGVTTDSKLVRIDKTTARATVLGSTPVMTNTLACSADGEFYSNLYGSGDVYSYTLNALNANNTKYDFDGDGTLNEADCQALLDYCSGARTSIANDENADLDEDGDKDTYDAYLLLDQIPGRAKLICTLPVTSKYIQAMETDPNSGVLYWASYCTEVINTIEVGFSVLYEIDPETGEFQRYQDVWDQLSCLLVLDKDVGSQFAPVSGVTDLTDADRDKLYKYQAAEEQGAIASIAGVDNSSKLQLLEEAPERKEITITLTAENSTTNGLFTVEYPETMALVSHVGHGDRNSFAEAGNTLTFAYISEMTISANQPLATLVFEASSCDSSVTIAQKQENNQHYTDKVTQTPAGAHNWSEWEETKKPTCTSDGQRDRSCSKCGESEKEILSAYTYGHAWTEWAEAEKATGNTLGQENRICELCGELTYRWTLASNMTKTGITSDFGRIAVGRSRVQTAGFYGIGVNRAYALRTQDDRMCFLVELSDKTKPDDVVSVRLTAEEAEGSGYGTAIKRLLVDAVEWDNDDLDYTVQLQNGIGKMTAYSYTNGTEYKQLDIYFCIGEGGEDYLDPFYMDTPGAITRMGIWGAKVSKVYWEESTDEEGRPCKTGYIWLDESTAGNAEIKVELLTSLSVYEGWKEKGTNVSRTGLTTVLDNGSAVLYFCCSGNRYTLNVKNHVNLSPERLVAGGEDRATVGQDYEIDLTAIFVDQNGDVLTYEVSVDGMPPVPVEAYCSVTPVNTGIMTLVFTASDGASRSEPYTLILTVSDEAVLIGDVNGDGEINLKDASVLMRHLVGWEDTVILKAADVNGDNEVSTKDATHLMRYLAGWDVTLGKETET